MKNASDIFKDLPDGSEFAKGGVSDSLHSIVGCMNDAFGVLENTPDIGLDWNEEMQIRAKDGIVSAMQILVDGMKSIGGESHYGDPCVKCGTHHDEVSIGRCSPND